MKLSAKKIENKSKYLSVLSFDYVDSTNSIAKRYALRGFCEGYTIVSTEQSRGRGRLGRSFVSQKGGVYFSIILRPEKSAEDTLLITAAAAVAAARAIEAVSRKKCEIKWVNDVYIDGKKVCGILTEGAFLRRGSLYYAVLGVGINVFMPKDKFPAELQHAGSVFGRKWGFFAKKHTLEKITAAFANNFFEIYNDLPKKTFIKEYQERSLLTNKEITYIKDNNTHTATVIGIDGNARLVIKEQNETKILSHGEVQIVGIEGIK